MENEPLAGPPLLLDTTVYIDVLKDRTPAYVDSLLVHRTNEHSAVCLAELSHAFGRLDPSNQRTKGALRQIEDIINEDIAPHRLHAPTATMWAGAAMLAGAVSRRSGAAELPGQRSRVLNDALIYLQAATLGCEVLTRNVHHFDFLNQIFPSGAVVFYSTTDN